MQQQIQDFQRHLRLALVIPLLLAAILGTIFALQTFYLTRSMKQVDHSYQVQMRSRTALRLMLDMETGLRGYLLTGEERFLEPFRQSAPQVEPLLNELAALVQNDPQQTRLVQRMRDEYRQWHVFSTQMIGLRQKSGPFNDVSLNVQGKEIMDKIRTARDHFVKIEEQNLSERIANVRQTTTTLLVMGIVLSLLMGIFWATFSRRELHVVARSYNKALQTALSRTEGFIRASAGWVGSSPASAMA